MARRCILLTRTAECRKQRAFTSSQPSICRCLTAGEASILRQNCWQPITSKATLMTTTRPTVPITKTPLTASCRSLKSMVKWFSSAICRRTIPRRLSRGCSICISPIVTRARSAATTQPCCSRTTAACSATVPIAASTVSLPPTRSPPASHLAFMMPPPLNVLIFPLVKSTISPRHVPVTTTSTGRTTTREVHWYGLAIPTGTIRVWITSQPAAEPWNTVATKTV